MAEPSERDRWTVGLITGYSAMGFAMVLMCVLLYMGNDANSMHRSAQEWCWWTLFAVMGGGSVGPVVTSVTDIFRSRLVPTAPSAGGATSAGSGT